MAGLRFGTDGVRGRAFDELTTDLSYAIGRSAAVVLGGSEAIVGRDTRESGPRLRDALASGLVDGGVRPLDLGVVPTPAVAHAAIANGAFGVMISASHNPWFDNGIKLFTDQGNKLSDAEQAAIEESVEDSVGASAPELATPMASIQSQVGRWVSAVKATATESFSGMSLVLDTANGAASHVVAPALVDLGATVSVIGTQPNGRNINEACGSTYPGALAAEVVAQGADLGIALDGDADRLVCVDHQGEIVNGDHLMAILAADLRARDRLTGNVVVVTVMSNLGFHRAMRSLGTTVHVTPVGDRHILKALSRNRWSFGGEQSGHLIFRDLAVTGDGFLSAVQILAVMARSGRTLADLSGAAMTSYPQVLRNVRVSRRIGDPSEILAAEIAAAEAELGAEGRVLVRSSGTEPLVRVMVEAAAESTANRVCDELCVAVSDRFGG